MERQTQIPAPQGGMQPRSWWCEWCGKQAFERIEIEPARWGQVNGQRTLVRRAITAWVCPVHVQSLHKKSPDVA
jgi:hypothetical protein